MGLDPKFSYDAIKGIYGVDMRLTLTPTAKVDTVADAKAAQSAAKDNAPQVTGGLEFGWQSDKHSFVVGLFVGAPMSFTSN
jgi:hypothetical protein